MDIETLKKICADLPGVTEDVKWEDNYCLMVGEKMFCITSLDPPHALSIKVKDEEFAELTERPGIIPAPYLARYKWVLVEEAGSLSSKEWRHYIRQSYELVKAGLSKKILKKL